MEIAPTPTPEPNIFDETDMLEGTPEETNAPVASEAATDEYLQGTLESEYEEDFGEGPPAELWMARISSLARP